MLKAVIVEDEKKSRETLTGLLKLFCNNVEVVAEADDVQSGIEAIETHSPDILFLDIQMPDGNGFQLLEALKEINFEVIFTTAYDQFAIKAIKFSALDYLLKPIFPDDLKDAVRKAEEKIGGTQFRAGIQTLVENMRNPAMDAPKIVLSTFNKIHVVHVKDITRCESDNYYTKFYFTKDKELMVSKTLKEVEELLSGYNFIRPHKSHLVNLLYVKNFARPDGGSITMADGTMVPVSRRKRESIIELLTNLQ
jgi:two-component system, LytTR family, response regulator